MEKERELAIEILDVFEDKIEECCIVDDSKTGDDSEAHIYGTAYYELEDRITEMIKDFYNNYIVDNRIQNLIENIKMLENANGYNVDKLLESMNHQLKNLNYYYGTLCKKKGEKYIRYFVGSIKEHTLIYVNLGRGFPKEIMDGHWCYVLKMLGAKAIIIPTTSKKKNELNMYEMDIDIDIHGKRAQSRLKLSDLRTIDIQRIYSKKGTRTVHTNQRAILKEVVNFIL